MVQLGLMYWASPRHRGGRGLVVLLVCIGAVIAGICVSVGEDGDNG